MGGLTADGAQPISVVRLQLAVSLYDLRLARQNAPEMIHVRALQSGVRTSPHVGVALDCCNSPPRHRTSPVVISALTQTDGRDPTQLTVETNPLDPIRGADHSRHYHDDLKNKE